MLPRARRRGLLPPARRRLVCRQHRLRQHPGHAPPAWAATRHGLAPLLGARDARRRLPLRPRRQPRPPDERLRPVRRLPRRCGPGPRPVRPQADRRAVGRGPGRLRARELPSRMERVERPLPRHRARLLAQHPRDARRLRHADHGLVGPVRPRAPADRVRQPRHRPRRLHAVGSRQLRRQAQRGQRRGQPRRLRRQPQLELRCRRPDRRPSRGRAARAPAAQPALDPAALRGHTAAAQRRRAWPHAGRQQQHLLPGQRRSVGSTGWRSTRS